MNGKKDNKVIFLENYFIKKEGKQILKNLRKINLVKEGFFRFNGCC